ncbi:MAG TPA: nicotinate-nucleotide adenylyltransferase [Acidimicrobiales bacterium]|nr:nicotinate-nucleotide adenylyltransferase [Acidimicrobiales bacterium]
MAQHERIGVFGGTFDPIHTGHVETAEAVHRSLDLDRTLLVVANEPWQKEGTRSVTPAEDRLAMVEAAAAGRPGLEPSRLEIDRGGPSYTVDTVDQLHRLYPGSELFLVVGADVVPDLSTWRNEAALQDSVVLVVVDRPGATREKLPPGWHAVSVPVLPFDVSSTELRGRLEAGKPVDGLVPEGVIRCIRGRNLYATSR